MTDKTQTLGSGSWLRLIKSGRWEWVQRLNCTGVVGLIPFTDVGEVVLVEQPRAPMGGKPVLEIPAGLVGDIVGEEDEDLERAAHRELEEETGYRAATLRRVTEIPSCAGMTEETMVLYVATGLQRVGPGGGDDTEDITVHVVPLEEFRGFVDAKMAAGVMIDPKVFAVPYFAN